MSLLSIVSGELFKIQQESDELFKIQQLVSQRGSERGDRGEEESLSHSDTHTQRQRARERDREGRESLIDTHW